MKRVWVCGIMAALIWGMSGSLFAAGTVKEAKAMVQKAIAYYKISGKDKALAEVSDPKGQFVKEDLYVTVYDLEGNCLAHGFNQKMIGLNMMSLKDVDGKLYIKDRIELAKSQGSGWQDFKYTNPVSKNIEPKRAYFEKVDNIIFMCGAYNAK